MKLQVENENVPPAHEVAQTEEAAPGVAQKRKHETENLAVANVPEVMMKHVESL